uniref:DNA pilot protein VP2 n=1 Tax=Microviridae sp. cthcR2 TaxID=2826741 RepID=A0A8S5NPK1_9VIRU|nr:MAG TPA: DNA pilot protein VP2 [Microviridae sp. cthcR2]
MSFKNIIGGLFGGIGSVVSGAVGSKTTSDTNKTNLKINQMNNDFNAREAQKARDFQLAMWNRENEYNSAASQRKRLEEAGYNPYMSDAQAGTAAGMSGTSASTASGAVPQIPYTPDFQSVGVNLASALKMMSEKKKADIENLNMSDLLRSQIWQNIGATDWRNASPEARAYNLSQGRKAAELGMASLEENLSNQRWSNNLLVANISNTLLDAEAKTVLNKYLDENQRAELNIKAANYEYLVMSGQMKSQEVQNLIADEILTYAKARGRKIANRVAEQTAGELIKATNNTNMYFGDYYASRNKYSPQDAFHDSSTLRSNAGSAAERYRQSKFDTKLQPWREAVNSTNMIFNGIGSGLDAYTRYQNGKVFRSRDYGDWSIIEDYMPNPDGGYTRNKTKRRRR